MATTSPSSHDGWDLVRLAEVKPTALRERVRSEVERGERDYQPLPLEGLMKAKQQAGHESPRNRARFERFSDYVIPGESVVEVGCGWGFVGARVLAADAGSYRGMDLEEHLANGTRRTLERLGHTDRVGPIVQRDLYTLTPADLEDASLVICSEVIEHVPDPEGALRVLGAALPVDGALLFSVPLLDRLEDIWGHLSIFTADRLIGMVEDAGLVVHHVEPLVNQWVIILVGHAEGSPARRDERLERVRAGAEQYATVTPPETLPPVPPQPLRFENVPVDEATVVPVSRPVKDRLSARVRTTMQEGQVSARITAFPWSRRRTTQGLAFSLDGVGTVEGVRLELGLDAPAHVLRIDVVFRGPGERDAARWRWNLSDAVRASESDKRTAALRPGRKRMNFTGPEAADLTGVEQIEVLVTVEPAQSVTLTISRLAWIR